MQNVSTLSGFFFLFSFCANTYHKLDLCKFWLKTEKMRNSLPEQCKMPEVKLGKFGYNMVSLKSLKRKKQHIHIYMCTRVPLSLWSVFYNVLLVKNQQGCLWLVSWRFFLESYKSCLQNEHIIYTVILRWEQVRI